MSRDRAMVRSARGVLGCGVVVALAMAAAGCIDRGPPSTEDQMRSMGLPLDSLVTVDDETQVTVRTEDGTPELLIFVADVFGGSDLGINPAKQQTINGGMVGDAISPGPHIDGKVGPAHQYLFGAGQSPLSRVETDEPGAMVELVNRDVNGWLIEVPGALGLGALPWRLVGADETVLYESVGTGMPEWGLAVDDDTQAFVRIRDGVVELLVYTPNAFGGSALAVTPADIPTVNGGLAGTATSPSYRYLFGAGQGPLKPNGVDAGVIRAPDQTPVSPRTQSTEVVVDAEHQTFDATWIIVVPGSVPISDVHWKLVDPDRHVLFEAVGLTPSTP